MKNMIDEKNIESFTYNIGNRTGIKLLVKKIVRKLSFWLLQPIGDKQNAFNQQVYTQMQEIEHTFENIECKLSELQKIKKGLDEQKLQIRKLEQNIDYHIGLHVSGTKNDIDVMGDKQLLERIEALKSCENAEMDDRMADVRNIFQNCIDENVKLQDTREVIVVLCSGLKKYAEMEAIRKEAFSLYKLLTRWSKYHVKLVSLEEQEQIEYDGNVITAPEDELEKYFSTLDIKLILAVESDISLLYRAKSIFFKYKTIARVTGQNPLAGVEPCYYEHIRHLNDMGFQRYDVYSKKAKTLLEDAGLKNVEMRIPVVDTELWTYKEKMAEGKIRIGFASSPMADEQCFDRGMELLSHTMAEAPEAEFHVLWRSEEVKIPEAWKNLDNCKIYYGKQNVEEFYDKIHMLMIPYATIENNHACSISALEAMLQGIPVVATEVAGVSDLVNEFGIGEVCEPVSAEVVKSIKKIKEHYTVYNSCERAMLLRLKLSGDNIVAEVENYADEYLPDNITTLGEWRYALEQAQRTLVKGPAEIKAYYSQFEIAENYNNDRFMQFPENCIDLLERTSIGVMIQDRFKGAEINILDIAPGDGRIMQEDLKYGKCLGVDSSEAMLRLMKKRFQDNKNLQTKTADYFEDTVEGEFDVITTFRYIRHFEYYQRKILYRKIRENMTARGMFIFDVPNIKFEMPVRNRNGWDKYNIYDFFTTKEEMTAELENNGFKVEYIIAVGSNLMSNIPEECKDEPITWTFGVIKA